MGCYIVIFLLGWYFMQDVIFMLLATFIKLTSNKHTSNISNHKQHLHIAFFHKSHKQLSISFIIHLIFKNSKQLSISFIIHLIFKNSKQHTIWLISWFKRQSLTFMILKHRFNSLNYSHLGIAWYSAGQRCVNLSKYATYKDLWAWYSTYSWITCASRCWDRC